MKVGPIALPGAVSVGRKRKRRVSDDLNAFGLRNGMVELPWSETVKAAADNREKTSIHLDMLSLSNLPVTQEARTDCPHAGVWPGLEAQSFTPGYMEYSEPREGGAQHPKSLACTAPACRTGF